MHKDNIYTIYNDVTQENTMIVHKFIFIRTHIANVYGRYGVHSSLFFLFMAVEWYYHLYGCTPHTGTIRSQGQVKFSMFVILDAVCVLCIRAVSVAGSIISCTPTSKKMNERVCDCVSARWKMK